MPEGGCAGTGKKITGGVPRTVPEVLSPSGGLLELMEDWTNGLVAKGKKHVKHQLKEELCKT